jgi:hypothetical protein
VFGFESAETAPLSACLVVNPLPSGGDKEEPSPDRQGDHLVEPRGTCWSRIWKATTRIESQVAGHHYRQPGWTPSSPRMESAPATRQPPISPDARSACLSPPSYYLLRAPAGFHLASVFVTGSKSVFVVASTKRPPDSSRNVPGRRIALWYSLDGGRRWQTSSWTITKPSPASRKATVPPVRGLDEQTAIARLVEQGLAPEIKLRNRCSACATSTAHVLTQTPAPGRRLWRYSLVTIQVAA